MKIYTTEKNAILRFMECIAGEQPTYEDKLRFGKYLVDAEGCTTERVEDLLSAYNYEQIDRAYAILAESEFVYRQTLTGYQQKKLRFEQDRPRLNSMFKSKEEVEHIKTREEAQRIQRIKDRKHELQKARQRYRYRIDDAYRARVCENNREYYYKVKDTEAYKERSRRKEQRRQERMKSDPAYREHRLEIRRAAGRRYRERHLEEEKARSKAAMQKAYAEGRSQYHRMKDDPAYKAKRKQWHRNTMERIYADPERHAELIQKQREYRAKVKADPERYEKMRETWRKSRANKRKKNQGGTNND